MREPDQRLYMAYYINVNTVGHGLYKIKIKRLKNLWIHDFNVPALVYPTKKNNKLLKYLLQFKLNVLQNDRYRWLREEILIVEYFKTLTSFSKLKITMLFYKWNESVLQIRI